MSKRLLFLISVVLLLSLAGNILAANVAWDNNNGTGDRRWDSALNWVGDNVPTDIDVAIIDDLYTDASNGPIIQVGIDAVCDTLYMGQLAAPSVEAVLTMTGGTLTTVDLASIGDTETGDYKFDLSDGTVTIGGRFALGYAQNSNVTFNMDGGNLSTTGDLFLGVQSSGTSNPVVNINGGNIFIAEDIELAEYAAAAGTINISGGTIEVGDNIYVGWEQTGPATINMTGGTVTSGITTASWMYIAGGYGMYCYLNLDGGTLNVPGLAKYNEIPINISEGTFILDGDYINVANGYIWDPCAEDWNGTLATPGVMTAYGTNNHGIIDDANYPSELGKRAVLLMDYGVTNPGKTTVTATAIDADQAWNEKPTSGSTRQPQVITLSWSPGLNAASHDVYFGSSFDDVNNGTGGTFIDNRDTNSYSPGEPLILDTAYYWRIDEVNGATTWKGIIWNFRVAPGIAVDPSPADGASDVLPATVLSWAPGIEAVSHELYFSTDFNDVNDRLITPVTPGANSYNPGSLEFETTYYWAVDEINMAADVTVWAGDVWSFTTTDHLIVDDFDSYVNNDALYDVWDDYWGNGTGSAIYIETDSDFVYEGNSLKFDYDNAWGSGVNYTGSRIDADTADLDIGSDWTLAGAKALWLVFAGQPGNSATENDRMWVELEDTNSNTGVVIYDGDPNDVKKENYQEWSIDLGIFDACGVSLANIDKVHIGFGGPQGGQTKTPGGTGTVWFDRIEVWPPWCRTELVAADITGDCVTNSDDLELLAADWLLYDYNFIAAEPCEANLIGWWKLDEGTGTITVDSSIYGNDGNIIEAAWTTSHPNDPCNSALDFDGDGVVAFDHVLCAERVNDLPGIYPAELMPDKFTVTCWTRLDSFSYFSSFVGNGMDTGTDECGFFFYNWGWVGDEEGPDFGLAIRTEAGMYYVETEPIYDTKTWYHLATTYDGNYASIYVDGQLAAGPEDVGGPIRWISEDSNNYPERFTIGVWLDPGYSLYVNGVIDDVRYYNIPLSQGDIALLWAGIPPGTELYQPVPSPANITDPEPPLSRKVNFMDYCILADNWLVGPVLWPSP